MNYSKTFEVEYAPTLMVRHMRPIFRPWQCQLEWWDNDEIIQTKKFKTKSSQILEYLVSGQWQDKSQKKVILISCWNNRDLNKGRKEITKLWIIILIVLWSILQYNVLQKNNHHPLLD
jgi:hypothetical protein